MRSVRIFRHPDCARCARIARTHRFFDLFGNIEVTTDAPPTGPLRMGEIVVENRASGTIEHGAEAFRLIIHAVPFYAPARLLLRLSRFRAYIEQEFSGCADGACEVRSAPTSETAPPARPR